MYHISDDKRARKSAELICEGLLTCLEEKPLPEITVTDLWKASGVSRATFYRLFDNVLDVLTYQCGQILGNIIGTLRSSPPQERTYRQMTITILSAAMEHCQLLSAVSENNRLDIIYSGLRDQIPVLHEIYGIDGKNPDGHEDFFLQCVCSLISTAIDFWVRGGQKQDPETLCSDFARVTQMLNESFAGN